MAFINRVKIYFGLMRYQQWIKNCFVFAALIFSRKFLNLWAIEQSFIAFIVFCGLASAVYIFNDLNDLEADKNHPHKKNRALASGAISVRSARLLLFVLLVVTGTVINLALNRAFAIVAITYLLLNVFFTLWIKRIVLLDVMAIATNYVLRVVAGTVVINAPITPWLIILSTLLALFLALGKRRHELLLLGDGAFYHRSILKEYSIYFIDQLIGIVTTATVVVYSFYTMDPGIQALLGTAWLPLTIPFVLFGIFRYLYLVHQKKEGGNPTAAFLADRPLLINSLLLLLILFFFF